MNTQKLSRRVRSFFSLLTFASIAVLSSCATTPSSKTPAPISTACQRTLLDNNWSFHLGDFSPDTPVMAIDYNDQQWPHVNVPHDYILDGKYASTNDRNHGYLPYDVAWYRKHFFIPPSDQGKILSLDFDGVFRDAQVWLNGQLLGAHASGYTPFSFDISKLAKIGTDNLITVRVDPRQFEGWWYEGAGIYRHVHLTSLSPLHIPQYGTYVVSTVPNGDQGAHDQADISIQTSLLNSATLPADFKVVSEILSPAGQSLSTLSTPGSAGAGALRQVTQHTTLSNPALWSLESPHLYHLRTTIFQNDHPVDSTVTTFGIRTIRFDAEKGFFLNGKHVEIQGVACHQDLAGVGVAVPDSLESWRVQQFKNIGGNGWRTAHNPPNESVLDACDRIGMLVMDENRHLGDAYSHHSPKGTTANDLSDLATMIQRDRNHPSIIMWSMCNEENLQGTPEGADIVTAMMNVVHRYDKSRPITSAMNGGGRKIFFDQGIADVEDIIGVNYNYEYYDAIHQHHSGKPMFGSEDSNEKTARGQYTDDRAAGLSSAYNLSEKTWTSIHSRPYLAGSYTWTGFDYKGEPNPWGWPDVSNNTGLLDSCGFPKDKAFYFQSCWSTQPMVHIMPTTWNGPTLPGKPVRVLAFSNAKQVELFLNGKSLGTKNVPQDRHAEWQVPFQPGQLLAKASSDGHVLATDKLETTNAPARIKLSADHTTLHADNQDAVVVVVSILDDQGRIVPDSSNCISFELIGPGKILGVGNGNPTDHDSDKSHQRNAFHGHCIVILQSTTQPGPLHLAATSPNLTPDSLTLKVR